jgi:hypothetical protein
MFDRDLPSVPKGSLKVRETLAMCLLDQVEEKARLVKRRAIRF